MTRICVVTVNEQERDAVEAWKDRSRRQWPSGIWVDHLNLGQQGNIGSHHVLTERLASYQKSQDRYDIIIGYACAGLPSVSGVSPATVKIGDAVLVEHAAYRDMGKVIPLSDPGCTCAPHHDTSSKAKAGECLCCAAEAVFLRRNRFPHHLDPYALPAGIQLPALLSYPWNGPFDTGQSSVPHFPVTSPSVLLHSGGWAFTTDKVMSASPKVKVQRTDELGIQVNHQTYAESLYEFIAERPGVPVAVDMEAFGMFAATSRLAGQTYLLRVLTDDCVGKAQETLGTDNKPILPDEVQRAYLDQALPALDALIGTLVSRRFENVALMYVRRFAAYLRDRVRATKMQLQQMSTDDALLFATTGGVEAAWQLAAGGLASPLQAYVLMRAKYSYGNERRLKRQEFASMTERIRLVAEALDDEDYDEDDRRSLPRPGRATEDDVQRVNELIARLDQRPDVQEMEQRLATVFRDLDLQGAMAHALCVPYGDPETVTEDEINDLYEKAEQIAGAMRGLNGRY